MAATAKTSSDTFKQSKELLMSTIDRGGSSKCPAGAVDSVWMTLMAAPNDHYNEVYPGILLGDESLAKDISGLKAIGVTHVLNAAQGKKFNQIDTNPEFYQEAGITFLGIPAVDIMTFKMAPHHSKGADFIKEALDAKGKLYVHCKSGVSRSATLVLAYLIHHQGMPLLPAVKLLREKRKILPNDGFLRELATLSDSLYAEQQT